LTVPEVTRDILGPYRLPAETTLSMAAEEHIAAEPEAVGVRTPGT
jgi:hypothetical protein